MNIDRNRMKRARRATPLEVKLGIERTLRSLERQQSKPRALPRWAAAATAAALLVGIVVAVPNLRQGALQLAQQAVGSPSEDHVLPLAPQGDPAPTATAEQQDATQTPEPRLEGANRTNEIQQGDDYRLTLPASTITSAYFRNYIVEQGTIDANGVLDVLDLLEETPFYDSDSEQQAAAYKDLMQQQQLDGAFTGTSLTVELEWKPEGKEKTIWMVSIDIVSDGRINLFINQPGQDNGKMYNGYNKELLSTVKSLTDWRALDISDLNDVAEVRIQRHLDEWSKPVDGPEQVLSAQQMADFVDALRDSTPKRMDWLHRNVFVTLTLQDGTTIRGVVDQIGGAMALEQTTCETSERLQMLLREILAEGSQ